MLLKYHECLTCVIRCFRYSTNLYLITVFRDMTQGNRNCSAVRARHLAFVWVCESYMEMLTISTYCKFSHRLIVSFMFKGYAGGKTWAGLAYWVQTLDTGWTDRGSNAGGGRYFSSPV